MVGRRPLLLLEAANGISGVSNALVMVAIPWLILERTGSAAAAGLAGALAGLPGIVVSPLVGALVDRLGRRTVSVGSDLFSALSVLLFPVADRLGVLGLGTILGLTLLGAVFDPAGYTARKALIPDVARASGTGTAWLNGIHSGVAAAGWVVGPVLAALAIASVGAVETMWFAGAAFLGAAGCVWLLAVPNRAGVDGARTGVHPDEARSAEAEPPHESLWASAAGGLRTLRADRPVWILTLAIAVISLIYLPTESVLLPVHYEGLDQPRTFGFVLSAIAAGAMVGAFGYGFVAARMSRHRIATVFVTLACAAYVPMAFLPGPAVMAASGLLLGLAWGPMDPLLNALVQDRFPADQHGRIYGVQLALYYAAPPLGQLAVGLAVQRVGVQPVIAGIAVCLVAFAAVLDSLPSLRGLDGTGPAMVSQPDG